MAKVGSIDLDEFYEDEFLSPICCNCKYDGNNFSCKCEQRAADKKAGKEKEKVNDFCGYFEPIFAKGVI